jgi:dUTP pyrophosphatase
VFAPGERRLVPTGIAAAIPEGFEGQVRPRSGLAVKHGVTVLNAPGTIDSDYRGEIRVPLINLGQEPFVLRRGDRIAQLLLTAVEILSWELVDALPAELPEGARGDRGFGSTGR